MGSTYSYCGCTFNGEFGSVFVISAYSDNLSIKLASLNYESSNSNLLF